jgi:prephenate dehydrogenase
MSEAVGSFEKPIASCTVAIAGLGLMGGSLGLALRGKARRVIGVARRPETLQQALALGAIDAGTTDLAGAAEADLIVLATPVGVIMQQIEELGRLAEQGRLRQGVVLSDMGSAKAQICAAMARLPASIQPVGGHPMCGKETAGIAAAQAGLYRGAAYVVCPLARSDARAVALVAEMGQAIEACPVQMDPERHDRLAAAISHVPYLASLAVFAAAANLAASDEAAWRMAAGGFRSTTRLAGSDPVMMADTLQANRAAVLQHVDGLRSLLDHFAGVLASGDAEALRAALADVQAQRRAFLEAYSG